MRDFLGQNHIWVKRLLAAFPDKKKISPSLASRRSVARFHTCSMLGVLSADGSDSSQTNK